MIIIERTWEEPDPRGGCTFLRRAERKCFADNDIEGVEEFINDESDISEYKNIKYKYTKL